MYSHQSPRPNFSAASPAPKVMVDFNGLRPKRVSHPRKLARKPQKEKRVEERREILLLFSCYAKVQKTPLAF
jgi:hypothetical protein